MFDVLPETSEILMDCGPTSLKMLLAYYGVDVDLQTLIAECNMQFSGCTGADLLRVGRLHGLDMTAFRMSADELIRQDRPAIIHWKHYHWCVFCGVDERGKVIICNPDKGRYGLDPAMFKAYYSNIVLFNGDPKPLDYFQPDYFGENEPDPEYFDN